MYYLRGVIKQAKYLEFLMLIFILLLFLPGCGEIRGATPTETAVSPANTEMTKNIPLYIDKFDEKLYKELGPFTEKPNALFIPGNNVPRPLFTRKDYYLKAGIDGRKELSCSDIAGLIGCISGNDFEIEVQQLEKTGIDNSWDIKDNIDISHYFPKVSHYFPKELKSMAIAEIGAGRGDYAHSWTQMVGLGGKVYMVDLDPFAVGFMEYKFSMENKWYGDKNQIIIIRNTAADPCLPKKAKIKLVYAQALHAYITSAPWGMSLEDYEKACRHFWRAVEAALVYNKKDPAKLIIFDHDYNCVPGKLKFSPKEAIDRILSYTSLKLEATFPHTGSGGGWVAVFAKKHR
jgi:hypothetical protein